MSHRGPLQIRRCAIGQPDSAKALRRAAAVLSPQLFQELSHPACPATPDKLLLLAGAPGGVRAAALLVECPGRTALLFVWPVDGPLDDGTVADLAAAAVDQVDAARVAMVQVLLEGDPSPQSRGLAAAGFLRLADLDYLQRSTTPADVPLRLAGDLEVVTYRPALGDVFAQAILASYEKTLDCPALLGMRDIEDVIAGHMGAGRFVPDLWLAVRHGAEPAGVMLINGVDHSDTCELVYLGLALPYRGKGLARLLLRHGLSLAYEHGLTQMILAVDRRNESAVRLYRALGFVHTISRVAWVKATR